MLPPAGDNLSFDRMLSPESSSTSLSTSSVDSPIRTSGSPDEHNLAVSVAALGTTGSMVTQPADNLDEIDHFCRFLGYRLRALDRKTRLQLQIKILQIIYDAEFGEV